MKLKLLLQLQAIRQEQILLQMLVPVLEEREKKRGRKRVLVWLWV